MSASVPLYDRVTPDTARGLTAALWRQSLAKYASLDPRYGSRPIADPDFHRNAPAGSDAAVNVGWFVQDAAAGGTSESFASTASPDGVRTLSAATGTDHFGIEAHYGATATSKGCVNLPTHSSDPRGRVVFETRVDFDASDNFFIGLTEPIVEFLSATGALPADSDYIGFSRTDAGDLLFVCANDNAGGTAVTDSATILAAASVPTGFAKVGFAVNVDNSVDITVNGVDYRADAKSINSLALPIESLTAKYATTRGATGDLATVSLVIDSCDVFVEASE